MELEYKLNQDEIEESLLCLNWKREGIVKKLNVILLTVIALGAMLWYMKQSDKFFLLILAGCSLLLLFFILYGIPIRRKYRARKMAGKDNECHITVPEKNIQLGMESEDVFTLKKEGQTYCIPKRILSEEQEQEIREIITRKAVKTYYVLTRRK
ncbi:MAG: hypothetical protein PHN80_12190 [Hespellia sp.]|nr:hypothetical protein [Hespellia sp.]